MPLNTDPEAIPDDQYNAELLDHAHHHPMAGPTPADHYEFDDELEAADARLRAAGLFGGSGIRGD